LHLVGDLIELKFLTIWTRMCSKSWLVTFRWEGTQLLLCGFNTDRLK